MDGEHSENLSPELQLAVAHTPAVLREPLTVFLELDARIARIVAATSEPMLGQMRLAWWRDQLGLPVEQRPSGDAVLDRIGSAWSGQESALVALIDGWEEMLGEALESNAVQRFAEGRAAPFEALARMSGMGATEPVQGAAMRWALVDAGLHVSEGAEREALLGLARDLPRGPGLARPLRGLAILDALSQRSLARGGRPLMEGRGAALTALRAGFIGR